MKKVFILCVLLLAVSGSAMAAPTKIRVLLWSEQTEPRDVYPTGINGALADYLRQFADVEVKIAGLNDPDAGLSEAVLAQTDVLIWFDHRRRGEVPDEAVERMMKHVRERGMGFIGLHSAHHSKPIKRLLDATGSWSSYVNHGKPERMWVVLPGHPIAEGVGDFTIPQTEIYTEPFEVPQPEAVIVEGTWESGHRSRDVMTWTIGKGRVVYIRAGHETYPIYFMPQMQRLVSNSIRYAARRTDAPNNLRRREAGPPATEHGAYFKRELLLVVNRLDDQVDILNGATGEKIGSVKTGAHPHEVALSPDASIAYVSLYRTGTYGDNKTPNDKLAVINLKTHSVEQIPLSPYKAPHAMVVDVMGMLWVTCENDGAVLVVDPNQKKVIAAVPTGSKGTHWIAMLPDSSKAYTSNKETPKLSVIDRLARKVIKEIPVPRHFRQEYQARRRGIIPTRARDGGEPSRVTAHHFDHRDIIELSHRVEVEPDILNRLCNEAGGAAVAGTHIRSREIVVNGLGNGDHLQRILSDLIAFGLCGLAQFSRDLHRAITADDEHDVDLVSL